MTSTKKRTRIKCPQCSMWESAVFTHAGRDMCRLCWVHELRRADRASIGQLIDTLRDKMICAYCGEPACEVEHVVPRCAGEPTWTVPACRECNALAGGKVFYTFIDKRDYVHKRLRQKYRRVLSVAEFDRVELSELGARLRRTIESALDAKAIVMQRLGFQLEFAGISDARFGAGK